MLPCLVKHCVIYLHWFRETWANCFDKEGVSYAFWSAHLETAKFDDQLQTAFSDKEDSCVEENEEEDESLDLLPQAMSRGFMLEDECATMGTGHEASSEVPEQASNNQIVAETDDMATAIATQPPTQTAVVDDTTSLPSQCETAVPSDVTEETSYDQVISMDDTTDNCYDNSGINHAAVETNIESNIISLSSDAADVPVTNPRAKLLTCSELLDLFRSLYSRKVEKKAGEPVVVGMVGYPNVGKSSTINTLIQGKKVPVSATPGRTKHFQVITLFELVLHCIL